MPPGAWPWVGRPGPDGQATTSSGRLSDLPQRGAGPGSADKLRGPCDGLGDEGARTPRPRACEATNARQPAPARNRGFLAPRLSPRLPPAAPTVPAGTRCRICRGARQKRLADRRGIRDTEQRPRPAAGEKLAVGGEVRHGCAQKACCRASSTAVARSCPAAPSSSNSGWRPLSWPVPRSAMRARHISFPRRIRKRC